MTRDATVLEPTRLCCERSTYKLCRWMTIVTVPPVCRVERGEQLSELARESHQKLKSLW